jgi:dihydropteroate synthase
MNLEKSFRIMGILNVTPDSFSDGGRFSNRDEAIARALKMEEDGADIIDIGGESSRPGSDPVPEGEELSRVIPVIRGIRQKSKIPISIDTTRSTVAGRALDAGADMINDISAGRFDPEMLHVAATARVPICLMHMKGTPKTMQTDTSYEDLMEEIRSFLASASKRAEKAGVAADNIMIDPGLGFGKSAADNVTIIRELDKLSALNRTILIGPSKKSFIGKLLGLDVDDRLEATLATLGKAYQNGASIFRVHDVGPAKKFLSMIELLT